MRVVFIDPACPGGGGESGGGGGVSMFWPLLLVQKELENCRVFPSWTFSHRCVSFGGWPQSSRHAINEHNSGKV